MRPAGGSAGRATVSAAAVKESRRPPYLLDTSAIMTFIEDEAGADLVEEALRRETTLIPWPVLLETYYVSLQEQGQAEADRRLALLKQLGVTILWEMDEATLLTAGRLKAEYRLSLADAMIAAIAVRREAVLIHKDPEFDALRGIVEVEPLPHKSVAPPPKEK